MVAAEGLESQVEFNMGKLKLFHHEQVKLLTIDILIIIFNG
jgi:hypothetical protein